MHIQNRKTWLSILLAAFLLLGSGCTQGQDVEQPELSPTVADSETTPPQAIEDTTPPATVAAPDFTVYDFDGNEARLSDFFGKPIVLNFWASWCGPCKSEMPDFQDAYSVSGNDISFLMINLTDGTGEKVDTASAFIAEKGYTFPVYYDKYSVAASTYGIRSIPTTFFIDADGNIVAQATGAIDAETLQRGLNLIA